MKIGTGAFEVSSGALPPRMSQSFDLLENESMMRVCLGPYELKGKGSRPRE